MNDIKFSEKRVGILGGTFDPIHLGHTQLLEYLISIKMIDEAWIMPSAMPPHKSGAKITHVSFRLELIEIAIRNLPHIKLELIETVQRSTPYYTYDSLSTLQHQHPDVSIFFIMGFDQACSLHTWKNHIALLEQFNFIILKRPGVKESLEHLPPHLSLKIIHSIVENPLLEISSSYVRELLKSHDPSVTTLITKEVHECIKRKGLYQHVSTS